MKHSWSIAWRQLMKEKRRVVAAVAGITFAVLLMLVQLGFEQALFKSVSLVYQKFNADLVLINPRYQNAQVAFRVSDRRLQQALAADGVDSVEPLYFAALVWQNPVTQVKEEVWVIAMPPRSDVLLLPEVNQQIAELRKPDTVLFDAFSRDEYGPVVDLLQKGPLKVNIAGEPITVAGVFHMGTSMATNGNLVISDENLDKLQPGYNLDSPSIGLIRLKPGADVSATQRQLRAMLPNDVELLTKKQLQQREVQYWADHTPIGFVFRLGLIMGIIVGSVVVYQILYNDVTQHLEEYATLKAIGYPDRFLLQIVLLESLILSAFGFLPGLVLSQAVFVIAHRATMLPLQLDLVRSVIVYALTIGMCIFSGALATRRLRLADPAEIF